MKVANQFGAIKAGLDEEVCRFELTGKAPPQSPSSGPVRTSSPQCNLPHLANEHFSQFGSMAPSNASYLTHPCWGRNSWATPRSPWQQW